jgi:hypothetical protein
MKTPILSAVALAIALPSMPAPLAAQSARQQHRERMADIREECREDRMRAMNQRQRERARRECKRELRQARNDWRQYRNYDYNRYEPGTNAYYADRYYRPGTYYQDRTLSYNDRVYRGQNGRYYCRRPDGTTGLIVGGLAGGILGNIIAPGGSNTLGTVLGAIGGGVAGRAIERNNVRCD